MDEIEETNNYSIITDYDDGVVCFGTVTQSQIERQKRLPRHTILPSNIQLSESLFNSNEDEEDENDETPFEDQNKSAFVEDEMISYVDVQEAELSTNNFIHNQTKSCRPSVSNVIEQSMNNHKMSVSDDNVCTLKYCSQQEDEDISYCCDSELENNDEYSIIADKYSITPGKQRLFDLRHVKSSIRAKTSVASTPFMDKIEEATSPLPKDFNSSPMLIHDVRNGPLENEDNLDKTSAISLGCKTSAVHFNETSCDLKFKKSIHETVRELSKSTNFNHSISESNNVNFVDNRKSSTMDMESSLYNSILGKINENNLLNKSTLTNNKTIIELDMPLNVINETLINTSNVSEQIFDSDKSMNIISSSVVHTADTNVYNNEEKSNSKEVDIKSSNISVDETMCISMLSTYDKSKDFDKSSNETSQTENTLNVAEQSFDFEKSTNMSNIIVPIAEVNDFNNEEELHAKEVDIKSSNTSVEDKIFDETMCISMLSTNNKNKDFDESSNETGQTENTINVAEQSFDFEKSTNMSNIIVPIAEINDYNNEELHAKEVDIKSSNTSVEDKIFDETMCISMLSTNNKNKDFDKSSNETGQTKDTLNVAEQSFDFEKSTNMSNIIVPIAEVNDYNNEEELHVKEVDIKSSNTSVEDKIFDETMCISMLSTNNKNKDFDESSNETGQTKDTLNVAEQSFDFEKSTNMSNIIVPIAKVNDYNNEEELHAKEVDIKSSNTSVEDKIFDETMCISMLSTNNKNKDFDESLNETSQTKDTLNVAEQSFEIKKSLDNVVILSPNVNDTLLLSKFRDNSSKYSANIEMPCSEKMDIFTHKISKTNLNTSEDLSSKMRQHLEFEQNIHDMCNDISSENCDTKLINSNICGHQTLENISTIEQMVCSDSFISIKDNKRQNLSVISENHSLDDNCDMNQCEHLENSINDLSTTSISKYNVNEKFNDIESITFENVSKSELNITNINNFQIKNKDKISIITLDEELDETKHNNSSVLSDILSEKEPCLLAEGKYCINNKSAEEHFLTSEDAKKICIQENKMSNPNFTAIQCTLKSENINKTSYNPEQNVFLNNCVQQLDLLSSDKNMHDNSFKKYSKLEQISDFEEDKKLQTFESKNIETQKLFDFSIIQQTSTFENQVKKQKLLDFSIVDQTPIRKSTQPTYLGGNAIEKKDALIKMNNSWSMLDLKVESPDKIEFDGKKKDHFQIFSKGSLSKNLSSILASDVELLANESNKINPSNHSNLSINPDKVNNLKNNIDEQITEETNGVTSSDKGVSSTLLINEQIDIDEPSSSLIRTTEKINLELSSTNESKQNKYGNESCLNEITGAQYQSTYSLNNTLNQNIKKPNSSEFTMGSNKQLILNPSNSYAIKDFSIIEPKISKSPESKTNINTSPVESHWNVSNLIEMSIVSKIDSKSNDQSLVSSDNPFIVMTSDNKFEKSINCSSDDKINNSAVFSYDSQFLTDIQMNDVSFTKSPEKNLIDQSALSIVIDQQKGNKRKLEFDQEQHSYEKKIKIETKEPKSMLYQSQNMYKSSEKSLICRSNTKENYLKSDNRHQKLKFSKTEENENESVCYNETKVLVQSEISDSIKQKQSIPRFNETPVLSDLSNLSNRKCP